MSWRVTLITNLENDKEGKNANDTLFSRGVVVFVVRNVQQVLEPAPG
jgi:hypothetical protein